MLPSFWGSQTNYRHAVMSLQQLGKLGENVDVHEALVSLTDSTSQLHFSLRPFS